MKWNSKSRGLAILVCVTAAMPLWAQQGSIVTTKHNLSISGPGPFKATMESQICIFCHTPHRSRTVTPLWNREDSRETYLVYSSTTFGGLTSQPTGDSKLCLSCHDGSIALGKVVSLNQEIQFKAGHRFLNSGRAFLGSNLVDDHPVSFDYDTSKGGLGIDYRPAASIIPPVHLDPSGAVQCTSCHDAHSNLHGDFLLTSNRYSALCLSCHEPRGWRSGSHYTSAATWNGTGLDPWPDADYGTVAENGCANCHRSHNAGLGPRLLGFAVEEDNCLRCHNGNVAVEDVASDLVKPYRHSPFVTQGMHDPLENPLVMSRHAECQDCHDPHMARAGSVAPPGVPGPNIGASGLSSSGQLVADITFQYELCYKCHADNNGGVLYVPRVIQQGNTRFEFNPSNPSFHPIEAPGRNSFVPSLIFPYNTSSIIGCTDCHQSDNSPDAGGGGAAGPHGSIYQPLLLDNYQTQDGLPESPAAYALCYRCHSRASILNDDSFKEHKKHVVEENASCSACHDSHGISSSQVGQGDHTHLINFDSSVVSPSKKMGQLFFQDNGFRSGSCTLLCHGENHKHESY